jgi:hypothetical protein
MCVAAEGFQFSTNSLQYFPIRYTFVYSIYSESGVKGTIAVTATCAWAVSTAYRYVKRDSFMAKGNTTLVQIEQSCQTQAQFLPYIFYAVSSMKLI